MSDLTSELNLALAVDGDDLADYLDLDTAPSLRTSLKTLDGLFNVTTGHTHAGSHQGGPINNISAGAIPDGSITTPKIVDAAVTFPKLAANMLEALYANSWYSTGANYTVVVASTVMWVGCTAAVQITLTAGINRPITIWAITGNSTVVSTSGTVIGGSINTSNGTVINGQVSQGDAITYKFDGTNWRAA